jgi:uncharacterized membrane protein YgaE (UPF0421/DUF939 family)
VRAPTWSSPASAADPSALRAGARNAVDSRVVRLRRYGWHIAQCAVAAALAWLIAREVLGHEEPFFAPVAAIVSLGLSYGKRLRRVVEVTAGVAVGVLIGDLFGHFFGTGAWQIVVVVGVAMTLAVLVDAGTLLIIQAGTQSAIITTLGPSPQAGLGRWLDAVCGGLVALMIAAIVPSSPLRRPREAAAAVGRELAAWLRAAAKAARTSDMELAYRTLESARNSDSALEDLGTATDEGLDVARSSPWWRKHRADMQTVAELAVPLDRAVRNARVLLRRMVVVARRHEQLPPATLSLLEGIAEATTTIERELSGQKTPRLALNQLRSLAADSTRVPTGQLLSADVVLAQVRALLVDLMQVCGEDADTAGRRVNPHEVG